jgi:hypothetical protein
MLAALDATILELHRRQFAALDETGLRTLIDLLALARASP